MHEFVHAHIATCSVADLTSRRFGRSIDRLGSGRVLRIASFIFLSRVFTEARIPINRYCSSLDRTHTAATPYLPSYVHPAAGSPPSFAS